MLRRMCVLLVGPRSIPSRTILGGRLRSEVLYRTGPEAEGGHPLLTLGWPEAAWHLELVGDREGETPARPSEEDSSCFT